MVFSSPTFLLAFLPLVLAAYFASPKMLRNLVLLSGSLLFYAWGEPKLVVLLLVSIASNYGFGLWVDRARDKRRGFAVLALGVVVNLVILGWFKYANFLVDNLNFASALFGGPDLTIKQVTLPLGISFFTFQAISYLVDVYRDQGRAQRNPINVALYIALFPQLVAGPIVRYTEVAAEIVRRRVSINGFATGAGRFVIGLGKKVLIANSVGTVADGVFALPAGDLSAGAAWLGIVCYTLQIYFDFSGYSDMAIGLGLMFGFRFWENFNYPYISQSVTEFWRRWHISLSRWYRDYVYIPLGGNRVSPWRTYVNLVAVFFLCGLWHGASWTFVIWGLYHGLFLVMERVTGPFLRPFAAGRNSAAWLPFKHIYTLLVVMVGWVLFRAESMSQALDYLAALVGWHATATTFAVGEFVYPGALAAIALGIVGSLPFLPWLGARAGAWIDAPNAGRRRQVAALGFATLRIVAVELVLLACLVELSAATHNPFIYFRF